MDGINNSTSVNRSTKIMGYDTSKAVNITHMMQKVDASKVDMDSFVQYTPNYYGMKTSVSPTALSMKTNSPMAEASTEVMAKADQLVTGYYDGEISADQLQTEYEALAKEYVGILEDNGYSSAQVKYCAAEGFYDSFKQKLLEEAVQRNNVEGKQYLSGELTGQRTYRYYNSDYYYQSEKAISAITAGAKNVAEGYGIEYGSLNTAPGLTAVGDDRYDNFNATWNYSSNIAKKYMISANQAPPENFKWFYEGGSPADENGALMPTSLTITHPDGSQTVEYYHQANTWASWGENGATEDQYHRVEADFPFGFEGTEDDPLNTFADLLKFSTGNSEVDAILNSFLENLMIYPEASYHRYMLGTGGLNIQA